MKTYNGNFRCWLPQIRETKNMFAVEKKKKIYRKKVDKDFESKPEQFFFKVCN
ncbi:hypothetical protein PGB90_010351 [Kerria lacca]